MTYLGTPGVKTGYCNFSPPGGESGPFKDQYHGAHAQDCYTRCTEFVHNCRPEYPTPEQFTQWGEYDAAQALTASPEYFSAVNGMAVAEGVALTASLASLAGLPIATALDASVLAGSALQKAIFPFAMRAIYYPLKGAASAGARFAATAADAAAAGAEVAGAVTFVVGVAIEFAVTTALETGSWSAMTKCTRS